MTSTTAAVTGLEEQLTAIFAGDPRALADPYPVYRRLREQAPVLRMGNFIVVSTYAGIQNVLSNPETFSARKHSGDRYEARRASMSPDQLRKMDALTEHQSTWISSLDRPEHTRVRSMVNRVFTRARVEHMRAGVQEIIDELLGEPDQRGTLDLVAELAFRLPFRVITNLFGSGRDDAEDIRAWSTEIALAIGTEYSNVDEAYDAVQAFRSYVVSLIRGLREGTERTDLFAELTTVREDGDQLSEDELVAMCVQLLFAGHETTTYLIANAVVALLRNPEQFEILRAEPELIPGAVEELLRYNTSNQAVHRTALVDTEIDGVPVKAGDAIRLLQGAANHDEKMFPDGDRLDVTRKNAARHIGFGHGIHSCLGLWLARMEAAEALKALVTSYPEMKLVGEIVYRPNFLIYGPDEVKVALR